MGLISWFKDRRFSELQQAYRELRGDMDLLNQQHEMLADRIKSVAGRISYLSASPPRVKSKKTIESPEMPPELEEFYKGTIEYQQLMKQKGEMERFNNKDEQEE